MWFVGIMLIYLSMFAFLVATNFEYSRYLPILMVQECVQYRSENHENDEEYVSNIVNTLH